MSWEDKEVLREVWDARVAVAFTLSPEEVVTLHRPEPVYLMVPRVSYFPLVMEQVVRYFARFVPSDAKSDNVWLESEGQKLKA